MERAELFRATLSFEGAIDQVPDNPFSPRQFGLSEACVRASASPCVVGGEKMQGGNRLEFCAVGMSDAAGKVISLNLNTYDQSGEWTDALTVSLAEEDVRKLGAAIEAVLELVPDAPCND